jgi:MFS family permease
MLIRASLGMAVAMSLIGLAQNVAQLVLLRLLAGLLGGYASGSTILVAAQTPKDRSAWALGLLSSAIMAGNVAGPLLGGTLEQALGIKRAFLVTGGLIFVGFLATALLLKEQRRGPAAAARPRRPAGWAAVPRKPVVLSLLGLSSLLMFATVSVEPFITVHVERLTGSSDHVALFAAIVFSATALGSIVSAPRLGQLADRVGCLRVLALSLAAATVLLACQSFAPGLWTFAALRFLTGLALGGVTPTVVATIRQLLPDTSVGLVLGYNVSAQYVGQISGPVLAGWVGGAIGTSAVFIGSAVLTGAGLLATVVIRRGFARPASTKG